MKCRHCGQEMELKTLKDGKDYWVCWICKLRKPADVVTVRERREEQEAWQTPRKEKKKLSVCLIISLIIGLIYAVYSIWYWFIDVPGSQAGDTAEQLGAALATALVYPHLICAFLAVIFNAIGLLARKRGFALTGAILYTVAAALMPVYAPFVLVEAVLSYIGFARMKKM